MAKAIWEHFLNRPSDSLRSKNYTRFSESDKDQFRIEIRSWFYETTWNKIYDFIEFYVRSYRMSDTFVANLNFRLEKYQSGYRFTKGEFIPITSKEEIDEIDESITRTISLEQINNHLITSISHFSNRENPDYRNSIKESISAVEATCCFISGEENVTLGKTLAKLEKSIELHGAMKSAFSALYGWTSDAGGIRHALTSDDIEVKFEDAKFMLVCCSAFINYLLEKKRIST